MNNSLLLIIAIAVSSLGAQPPVIADDNAVTLSAEQVVNLLLSPDRDDHQRGVEYVVDNKPDLTTQLSRLLDGLTSKDSLVLSACCSGLRHGRWDLQAMEKHTPRLFKLLVEGNRHAQMAARGALVRIAPSLRDRMPELLRMAKENPLALDAILAISKEIGFSKKQWISAWLPLAVDQKRCRNEICSMNGSSRILLALMDADQPDSVVSAILEMLASYRQKPKRAGELAIRMLSHRSSKVRAAAIASLDEIPHAWSSSRTDLLRIARTDDEELRAAATRRLFSDPSLGKIREEMGIEEKQVADLIDRAFSDDSSIVRRSACLASRFTQADRLWLARKLIERLSDPEEEVRMAAQVAISTRVGFALWTVNHDPDKLELYYRDLMKEQSDSPEQAHAVFNQTMSEFRKAVAADRAFLRFIENAAANHKQEAVRDLFNRLLTDDAREQARQNVPQSMRIEAARK